MKSDQGFQLPNYQSKVVPAAFSSLPPAEKDALLVEILKSILDNGDLSKVKPTNANLKPIFNKTTTKFTLPSGEQFEGEVIDGTANGKGKTTFVTGDGSVYEGNFQGGFEHGTGSIKFKNGDLLKCDTFNKSNPFGLAQYVYADKSEEWQGYNQSGQRTGPYTYTDKDGMVYFGQYKNDKEDGLEIRIPKHKNSLAIVEYKSGVAGPEKVYAAGGAKPPAPVPTTAPVAQGPQTTVPAPAPKGAEAPKKQ